MPNVMGREFPYTNEGMAAAEQYSQALGMRDGGMMGFRPVGYQGGGSVPAGYQGGGSVPAGYQVGGIVDQLRNRFYELRNAVEAGAPGAEAELIELIKRESEGLRASKDPVMTGVVDTYLSSPILRSSPSEVLGAPEDVGNLGRMGSAFGDSSISNYDMASNFLSPDDPALLAPRDPRRAVAVANRIQDDIEAGIPTRGSADGPDLTGADLLSRLSPEEQALFIQQRNSAPVEMNRGGIMSLREGGLASYGPGGGGVVNQLQDLGGRAEEFASSVQNTIGGGGMNLIGPQLLSSGVQETGAAPMLGQLRPSPFRQQI